jgi:hypothetical protein
MIDEPAGSFRDLPKMLDGGEDTNPVLKFGRCDLQQIGYVEVEAYLNEKDPVTDVHRWYLSVANMD